MSDSDRKLDALVYSLGWVVLILWGWLAVAWLAYVGWMRGGLRFVPHEWWPSPQVSMIFFAIGKLMVVGLAAAWIGVLLYRRRLRRG